MTGTESILLSIFVPGEISLDKISAKTKARFRLSSSFRKR